MGGSTFVEVMRFFSNSNRLGLSLEAEPARASSASMGSFAVPFIDYHVFKTVEIVADLLIVEAREQYVKHKTERLCLTLGEVHQQLTVVIGDVGHCAANGFQ
jgi:hypothetical protein